MRRRRGETFWQYNKRFYADAFYGPGYYASVCLVVWRTPNIQTVSWWEWPVGLLVMVLAATVDNTIRRARRRLRRERYWG
jgi:hypothetical protein